MQGSGQHCGEQAKFKVFVGGLEPHVDNSILRLSFKQFGNIKKILLVRDSLTGLSKGYGFITFADQYSFSLCCQSEIWIGPKRIDCHPVFSKKTIKEQVVLDQSHKIFVGGLSQTVTEDDLRTHFSYYGQVTQAKILYDGVTGNSRGFGFVLFVDDACVFRVLQQQKHKIHGKLAEVKRFAKSDTQTTAKKPKKKKHLQEKEDGTPYNEESYDYAEQRHTAQQWMNSSNASKYHQFMPAKEDKEWGLEEDEYDTRDNSEEEKREESPPNFTISGFFKKSNAYTASLADSYGQKPARTAFGKERGLLTPSVGLSTEEGVESWMYQERNLDSFSLTSANKPSSFC